MPDNKLKETAERQFEEWADREAQKHVRTGGNQGARFVRPAKGNMPLEVLARHLNKAARRKVN